MNKSWPLAIVPSSFIISQITAELFFFANLDISTEASVWPALTKTPPSLAIIGNTWPGDTISVFFTFFLDAILIVLALSFAEIPVVIPFLASIDIVKAVLFRDWLFDDIKDKFNLLAWRVSKAKQIKPRPYLAMKLIFFAFELDVEIIKSPSFSLFSSSTRMNIPPFLATLIIVSIEAKLFFVIKIISNVFR